MEEIENLRVLVEVVAKRIEREVKEDNIETLKELLWNVPTNILAQYARNEEAN